jgi:hypothetical protein
MKSIYLVAYYVMRPKTKRVRTNQADWQQRPDAVSYDEQVSITPALKNRDLSMAKIILDFAKKRVIKNDFVRGRTFDELFMYFMAGYPDQTKSVMAQIDPAYLSHVAGVAKQNIQSDVTLSSVDLPVQTVDTSQLATTTINS